MDRDFSNDFSLDFVEGLCLWLILAIIWASISHAMDTIGGDFCLSIKWLCFVIVRRFSGFFLCFVRVVKICSPCNSCPCNCVAGQLTIQHQLFYFHWAGPAFSLQRAKWLLLWYEWFFNSICALISVHVDWNLLTLSPVSFHDFRQCVNLPCWH